MLKKKRLSMLSARFSSLNPVIKSLLKGGLMVACSLLFSAIVTLVFTRASGFSGGLQLVSFAKDAISIAAIVLIEILIGCIIINEKSSS